MRKSKAYEQLGYQLRNTRWSWSAENEGGICIDLWRHEICWLERYAWFDSRKHGNGFDLWGYKIGNRHRIEHLQRTLAGSRGFVDAVILDGHHLQGVRDAVPWMPEDHGGERWKVTDFDEETGHFRAEVYTGLSQGGR